MIVFEQPLLLWLCLPLVLGWLWFARLQAKSVDWIHRHVSPRFRRSLTVHSKTSLRWHTALLLVAGLALVVAAAGPRKLAQVEAEVEHGRILLLVDASHSMTSEDLDLDPALGLGPLTDGTADADSEAPDAWDRFELARYLGQRLVAELPEHQFGIVTYSGTTSLHLPITDDRTALAEALRTMEWYSFYQNSGSNLAGALDAILPFSSEADAVPAGTVGDLQVVLLGDGELPFELDYEASLDAVVGRDIPVHSVAIGSSQGRWHKVWDYRDVAAGVEPDQRRVLVEYTTRRDDFHFERIAERTGGTFRATDGSDLGDGAPPTLAAQLADKIRQRPAKRWLPPQSATAKQASRDLSLWPLLLALVLVVVDTMMIGRPKKAPTVRFDLDRLGRPPRHASRGSSPLTSVLLCGLLAGFSGGCSSDEWKAYQQNERGIELDQEQEHAEAAVHYQRSAAYQIEPEVPTHNLGRSASLDQRHAEAHDYYQQALELSPDLAPALYNDGVTLYQWGVAELDPRGCELERTLDLWRQAARRFASTAELERQYPDLAIDAGANARFLALRIARIERLIAQPPADCVPPPPPPSPQSPPPPPENEDQNDDPGEDGDQGEDSDQEQDQEQEQEQEQEQDPGQGGDGGTPPPPPGQAPPTPSGLSDQELEQIGRELERIAAQAREDGTFHRRTRPEQFSKGQWSNPDSDIWW